MLEREGESPPAEPRAAPTPEATAPADAVPSEATGEIAGPEGHEVLAAAEAAGEITAPGSEEASAGEVSPPPWAKTYELPSARKVVSAGLQLAVSAAKPIRGASIYIGLLALGAFGPSVLLLFIGLARLVEDPGTAAILAADPTLLAFDQPGLESALQLLAGLAVAGFVLLIAISIDAQAIALSLLGGVASDQPLRLGESVTRARQTFWRLVSASLIVGVASFVASFLVTMPFTDPFSETGNSGIQFIGSMIGTLVVTPWAYASAGIVLGDVGAIEALGRSVSLFRARPRTALVVVLFTLVTAAIQLFAVGAGLEVAIRVAEVFDVGPEQGAVGLVVPAVLVFGFIVAFGSLTFTIAAIVAAPQVAAFLGLTFYAKGLDRARAPDRARFGLLHWVGRPMALAMGGVALVAALGVSVLNGLPLRPASPVLSFLLPAATAHEAFLFPYGVPTLVDDQTGDQGASAAALDLVVADYAFVPLLPDWLLSETFDCDQAHVACLPASRSGTFVSGAYVFVLRVAGRIDPAATCDCAWVVTLAQGGQQRAPMDATTPFPSSTEAFVASLDGGSPEITLHRYSDWYTEFFPTSTRARATWVGQEVVLFVPADELLAPPVTWGAQTSSTDGATVHDRLAAGADTTLPFRPAPELYIEAMWGELE